MTDTAVFLTVERALPRPSARGATPRAGRHVVPGDASHDASAECRHGPKGTPACDWVNPFLGDLAMVTQLRMCEPRPRPGLSRGVT
jgi:hypothetical protein